MSIQSSEQVREEQQSGRTFNPNEHLIQLKSREGSKDYLPVQWRLVWFREQCPQGTIETEMIHLDLDRDTEEEVFVWNSEKRRSEKVVKHAKGFAIFRAIAKDGKGGVAAGTKSEKAASFPDYIEKAETGSVGRALAALGYGTQFAPELNEEHRIVDSPVERQGVVAGGNGQGNGSAGFGPVRPVASNGSATGNGSQSASDENTANAVITEQQLTSVRKLCQHLGKSEPENVASISYLAARKLIQQLTAEYKEQKQKAS